jgi:hypothetical protein
MTKKKAPPKAPGRNGFKYQQQYGVIVVCRDEAHQERVYTTLSARGLKCKVVTV